MVGCSVFGCTNKTTNKISGITFHSFPRDPKQKELWIKAIRRENYVPKHWSRVCSEHFSKHMIDRTSRALPRLRYKAVPDIIKELPLQKKLDSLTPNAQLKTPQPLQVKQEPFEATSNDAEIQTELLFEGKVKNRILTLPGDLDIVSSFSRRNGNSNDQNYVLIISDDIDVKTILNSEDVNSNRAIIVSDGTNMQSEWRGNIEEDSLLNGTLDDTHIEIASPNDSKEDSSCENSLRLRNKEFYVGRVKELEEKMVRLRKEVRVLQQSSRRKKRKIKRLWKEICALNRYSGKRPCTADPIVHLMACDR